MILIVLHGKCGNPMQETSNEDEKTKTFECAECVESITIIEIEPEEKKQIKIMDEVYELFEPL
jgi:hypothetical protein